MKIMRVLCMLPALAATPALAVDFSTELLGQHGGPVVECLRLSNDKTRCDLESNLTLGLLCRFALDVSEPNLQLSEIIKRGSLSERIRTAAGNIDLSVDEAKLIKDQIVKFPYSVSVKYQAIRMIDPKGVE